MSTTTTASVPHAGLLEWLTDRHVDFEVHEHPEAFSAARTAEADGVDARTFAKVVAVVTDDGRNVLIVLDATDRADLHKVREVLGAKHVRLLSEAEIEALVPGFEPGATPAAGGLFGLPMIADFAVRDEPEISFNAGTHRHSVRVDRVAWERATGVRYADLAAGAEDRPAWAIV